MALARWQRSIVDANGDVLPSAEVTVRRESDNALAVLYSDRDGETPMGNPFNADASGFAFFYTLGGAYRITATSGADSSTWRHVGVGLAQEQDAVVAGVKFVFDSGTADSDPGTGAFRFNNATPGSATALYVNETDQNGVSVAAWLASLDDGGGSSDRGILVIRSSDGTAQFIATVTGTNTDNGTYQTVNVTVIASTAAATFVDGAAFGVQFTRSGADGANGEVSGPGATTQAGQIAVFSSGTGTAIAGAETAEGSPTEPMLFATAAQMQQMTPGTVADGGAMRNAAAPETVTDAVTVSFDWESLVNGTVTLGGNRTLALPSNGIPGTWRTLEVNQDGTGNRTLSYAAGWQFVSGTAPTLSTAANAKDRFALYCASESVFELYVIGQGIAAP